MNKYLDKARIEAARADKSYRKIAFNTITKCTHPQVLEAEQRRTCFCCGLSERYPYVVLTSAKESEISKLRELTTVVLTTQDQNNIERHEESLAIIVARYLGV